MNFDSYERFRFTDPRDDLGRLGIAYDLYTEGNIGSFFDNISKYSCVLVASNALHHPAINESFEEHRTTVYNSINRGTGFVLLHQANEKDFASFFSISLLANILSESSLQAKVAKDHPILHSPHELERRDYSLDAPVLPTYSLYYHSFPQSIKGFEGILVNEQDHFVLILGNQGRGRIVLCTGALDWYGKNDRLLHNLLIWASRSGDVTVHVSQFEHFLSFALEGIDFNLVSAKQEAGNPKILIVDDIEQTAHNPSTILLEIGADKVSLHSDSATLTRNRLVNALESMQLADGSWERSMWKTAVAMRALLLATQNPRLDSIQKGLVYLHPNIEATDSPPVLSSLASVIRVLSKEGVSPAEVLDARVTKVLKDARLTDFDHFTRLRLIRNLLDAENKTKLVKLFNDVVDEVKPNDQSLGIMCDILYVANSLHNEKVQADYRARVLEILKRQGFPTDQYESLEILSTLLALKVEDEICLKELIQNVFARKLETKSAYASALILESFSYAMAIPFYRNWLVKLELLSMTVRGTLLMSEWYDLEPNFNSLYAQLEKQKNEISKLNSSLEALESKERSQRKELEALKRRASNVLFVVDKRAAEIIALLAAVITTAVVVYELIRAII